MKSFLRPKSVAVVGVSQNPQKLGHIVLKNIVENGYEGKIYGVNPKLGGQQLLGQKCFTSLKEIKTPVDLVVIIVPARFVINVMEDAVINKSKNVIIITAGFKEVGNVKEENEIIKIAKENKIRILGPNCLGAIMVGEKLNASFAGSMPKLGKVAFLSQSGAICTAALSFSRNQNFGFSHFISLGNKSDISEIDLVEAWQKDEKVDIISLYLESIKDGKKWMKAIRNCHKPILVLEPGASATAQKASGSHTGSLAPDYEVLKSAYAAAGACLVPDLKRLLLTTAFLATTKNKRVGKSTVIITNAGGLGVMSSDLAEKYDLPLTPLSEKTQAELKKVLPSTASVQNPVDIIGDAKADRYLSALEVLINDEAIDNILVLLTPQATTEPDLTADYLIKYAKKTDKNMVAVYTGGEELDKARKKLNKAGVSVFDFPVEAFSVLHYAHKAKMGIKTKALKETSKITKQKYLEDEKPGLLDPEKTEILLKKYGLPVPGGITATNLKDALAYNEKIKGKIVMKVGNVLHKTEMKGVHVGVVGASRVKRIWEHFEKITPEMKVLMQPQIEKKAEIFIGLKRDKTFGEVMLFGTGGIYSEIWRDTSITVLPVHDFNQTISSTKMGKILSGFRGQNLLNIKDLALLLSKLQKLFIENPQIKEMDLNPVLVDNKGKLWCVDVKVIL